MQADDEPERPEPEEAPGRRPDRSRRGRGSMWKFGPSSTRRAVILALVVCALALSVAVPLRNYLGQRSELAEVQQQQQRLREQVDELERRKAELQDPAQIEAEARRRLRYVRPGETPYIVQLPGAPATPTSTTPTAPVTEDEQPQPWHFDPWRSDPGEGTER